jgi:hypothetical protein
VEAETKPPSEVVTLMLEPGRHTAPELRSVEPVTFYARLSNGYWFKAVGGKWVRISEPEV